MNRAQKMAWFNLTALIVILTFSAIFILWVAAKNGAANILIHLAGLGSGWLITILLIMVSSEWWAKKQRSNQVGFDERDLLIQIKALHIGVLALLGAFLYMWWLIVPQDGSVKTWLPVLSGAAAFIGALAYSIATLVQYGRGGKGGEK